MRFSNGPVVAAARNLRMIFGISAKSLVMSSAIGFGCCALWFCATPFSSAQKSSTTAPRQPLNAAGSEAAAPGKLPTATHEELHPAKVSLTDGNLTVNANNSDLSQILQEFASKSGMTINGLNRGPRIFGVYGPGSSREVLTELLIDSGYNFIMVGGAEDGTPRELLLTARTTTVAIPKSVIPYSVPSHADAEESVQPELGGDSSGPDALGAGAIAPAPSLNDQDDEARAQANLLRLQHQQEIQQQQNAPQ